MKNSQAKYSLQLLALLKNGCNQSKIFLLTLILVALYGCGTGSGPSSITDPATGKTLSLIWADEFSGVSLDTTKWNYDTGYGNNGWGNDEWQLYTSSSNNVTVENGNLVITARCDSGNCGKRDGTTTSARITTKGKFYTKYGSIQARIKIPGGKGTWPAFWMLGTNIDIVDWPKCGEIDILEVTKYDAADKTTHTTIHWYDQTLVNNIAKGWTYFTGSKTFAESLSNDYHIYEVDWNADRIIGKIDGSTYYTKVIDPATMEEFLRNFYLLFNVAVGGNLAEAPTVSGATWPQTMYVDWVRVYGSAPFVPSSSADAGLYSETKTDPAVPYARIINSADWSGDSAIPDLTSTAVIPKEGTYVLSAHYLNDLGKGWNGIFFDFGSVSVASFGSFYFSADTSKFANFKDLKIEFKDSANSAGSVMLSSLTPTVSGTWATYQIPLKSIHSADLSKLAFLGFISPVNASGTAIPGTLYFDDMYFGACTPSTSVTCN
jgi:beta-glucanase (GH16 family)